MRSLALLGVTAVAATLLTLPPAAMAATRADVVTQNANIAHAVYQDSLLSAQALREAIGQFLDNPNDDTLGAAREAWKASREPYGQTEVYRFRGGPHR